ncbi:hypothetical protein Tco_0362740 [Tanacetum coccineum]
MNRLNVTTLTPKLLAGPTFELMKGTCKSLIELEYFYEEVYKPTTEKLYWINPESRQYPHDLRKPLPLVPNSQGRHVIPFHHFINNDLEYLRGEDLVPNSMWSQVIVNYDKFALWEISHWGKKRRQFYAFASIRESARDVYSKRRIIAVTKGIRTSVYKFQRRRLPKTSDPRHLRHAASSRIGKSDKSQQQRQEEQIDAHMTTYTSSDDGTLRYIQTALNIRLKGIRMKLSASDFLEPNVQANVRAMIQAIDKRLKTRRIMQVWRDFVGVKTIRTGVDLRQLQRTIRLSRGAVPSKRRSVASK